MTTINPQRGHTLAEQVLSRIEHEQLSPRPRWRFIVKNYVFWCLGALAIVLGALAFAATLFEITNVDWHLSTATHGNLFSFFFAAAPIFWVVAFILLILIGYINVRYTDHGYRHSLLVIALVAGLVSLLLGAGIYAFGFGRAIVEIPGDHPPFYRPIFAVQQSWWLAPEKGLLGGQVVQVAPDGNSFVLSDFSDRTWEIYAGDLAARDFAVIARGGKVRIVGAPVAATSSVFHACFVFSWETYLDSAEQESKQSTVASSTYERNVTGGRSEICKGIRPYQQLRSMDEEGL